MDELLAAAHREYARGPAGRFHPGFAINSFQQNYAPTIGVWSNGWANGGAIDENLGGGAIVGTLQGLDPNQPENASLKYYFDTSANANPHGWSPTLQRTAL